MMNNRSTKNDLINRHDLIMRLKKISLTGGSAITKEDFEKLNLTDMLLVLADVRHETEYELCSSVAQHLLGSRPDIATDAN